jgi:hypothetical protein
MSELKIGAVMADETIYAGISPVTNKLLFVMPMDEPLMGYNETNERAIVINRDKAYGHDDWRVPTQSELTVIYKNKEKGRLKGTFNEAGEGKPFEPLMTRTCPGEYRASDQGQGFCTKGLVLKNGSRIDILTMETCSVRFVRAVDASAGSALQTKEEAAAQKTLALQQRLKEISQKRKSKLNI